jgi:RimJ/RimL family protein N-acetyltransferase
MPRPSAARTAAHPHERVRAAVDLARRTRPMPSTKHTSERATVENGVVESLGRRRQVTLVEVTPQRIDEVEHWFSHPEVVRRLGPRSWIRQAAAMLDAPTEGETFRDSRVLRAHGWVGLGPDQAPVGYIGGDVYDRWGRRVGSPDDGEVIEVDERTSMGLAYVTDPARWREGWGTALIRAAVAHPAVVDVAAFYLGIEQDNVPSWKAASRAGFVLVDPVPDLEGMVYWRRNR